MRTAALLVLATAGLASAGENLLRNGGFEDGRQGWIFYGFGGQERFEIKKTKGAVGKLALHVTKDGGGTVPRIWVNYDLPSDQRDGTLTLSFRAKARKLGSVAIQFLVYDAAGEIAADEKATKKPLKGTFKWKTFKKTIRIPPNAKGGRIFLLMRDKGQLWLDDVRVWHGQAVAAPDQGRTDAPLQIPDGGFEKSKSGWVPFDTPRNRVRAALDRKIKAKGKSSLRLERKGIRLFPEGGVHAVVRNVGKAKRVTLRVRARSDGAVRAVVVLLAEGEQGGVLGSARREVGTSTFQEVVLPLKLPPGTGRLTVALALLGPGKAWFDDVRLEGK